MAKYKTTIPRYLRPEYRTWVSMKLRCSYSKNKGYYKNYISRGITVCEQWINSFDNFYQDMGPKPSPKHSIDRINNDGNYEPSNCRWATKSQQDLNKREKLGPRPITFNGQTHGIYSWARILKIAPTTLRNRLNRQKWSIKRALTEPINNKPR